MEINKKIIYELNTPNKMLKFKSDALGIGKILATFVEYDKGKEEGSKVTASANFYISVEDAKLLARDILSGKITKLCKKAKESGQKYPDPVWKLQGGVSAEDCKSRGLRTDGKCLARVMTIVPGAKYPYCFKIEQGPGKRVQKDGIDTLIVPDWKKPEVSMMIPCGDEDLKKVALMLDAYIDAYITLTLSSKSTKRTDSK